MNDKRYLACRERIESLSTKEIKRIVDNKDILLWDTFNYNPLEGKFCPIAVAMDLHNIIENPTDDSVKEEISKRFYPSNIFKGVEGEFYTTNREEDMMNLCKNILKSRENVD